MLKPLILTGAGLLAAIVGLAAIAGVRTYIKATTPLHAQVQSAPPVTQSQPSPQWSDAVTRARQVIQAALVDQNLPGLSVAVGVGGSIVYAEGFGWTDIYTRAPVTRDTRFKMGTASKAITSAAVGVLLEKGRLKLDEQIQTYVPQFPKKPWPVTVRQLMGHTAGLTTDSGNAGPLFHQRCERPIDAVRYFADRDLLFEPGTQYRYSNDGWILVSAAIEAAASQPFLTFMREQIFRPLGMDRTGAESAREENPEHVGEPEEDAPILNLIRELILQPLGFAPDAKSPTPDLATFYVPMRGTDPRGGLHEMRPHNLSCYAGSMAFFSTSSDLVRFGMAMNDGTLLQPATAQLLQTSQPLGSGQTTGHGLGWDINTITVLGKPTQAVGTDGESWGGRVMSLITIRERGIVVAVMSNVAYADTASLALKVSEAFATKN